jgi:hypothetical protein
MSMKYNSKIIASYYLCSCPITMVTEFMTCCFELLLMGSSTGLIPGEGGVLEAYEIGVHQHHEEFWVLLLFCPS